MYSETENICKSAGPTFENSPFAFDFDLALANLLSLISERKEKGEVQAASHSAATRFRRPVPLRRHQM